MKILIFFLFFFTCLTSFFLTFLSPDSRKQLLDDALVDMVIKDSQPFSVVEDEGFRNFVDLLDPTYILPTKKVK